jgi:hypothetical protein
MSSFGGEVKPSVPCRRFAACKRSLHLPWKLHAVGKIGLAISRPYFLPSLIEVSHVAGAPLEMMGETKSGAQRACLYGLGASGLQGPGSAPYCTLLYSLSSPSVRILWFDMLITVSGASILLPELCTIQSFHFHSFHWIFTQFFSPHILFLTSYSLILSVLGHHLPLPSFCPSSCFPLPITWTSSPVWCKLLSPRWRQHIHLMHRCLCTNLWGPQIIQNRNNFCVFSTVILD